MRLSRGGCNMQLTKSDRGLTLLELVVAVLILALASVVVLRTTDQSRLAIGGTQDRILASLIAANRAEELRVLGAQAVLPDRVEMGGMGFSVTRELETTQGGLFQVTIVARSPRGNGARRVVYLVPERP